MITTVTLNPTLDKTLSVPSLQPGEVHRAEVLRQDLGGKGINVARTLQALEIECRLLCVFGGSTGQRMAAGLEAAGLPLETVWVEGETRQNITFRDERNNVYTKINEPGATLASEHLQVLMNMVAELSRPGDLWAFSGSLPPGAPDDTYARLIALVQQAGGKAFLDSSGAALAAGIEARPFALKPNSEEAAAYLDRPLSDDDSHLMALRRFTAHGIELVALSRGIDGLVLGYRGDQVLASPPKVPARSPIGAGDGLLAGLLWACVDDCDAEETARRAVACGTAAAMQEGTGVGSRTLVRSLVPEVVIVRG